MTKAPGSPSSEEDSEPQFNPDGTVKMTDADKAALLKNIGLINASLDGDEYSGEQFDVIRMSPKDQLLRENIVPTTELNEKDLEAPEEVEDAEKKVQQIAADMFELPLGQIIVKHASRVLKPHSGVLLRDRIIQPPTSMTHARAHGSFDPITDFRFGSIPNLKNVYALRINSGNRVKQLWMHKDAGLLFPISNLLATPEQGIYESFEKVESAPLPSIDEPSFIDQIIGAYLNWESFHKRLLDQLEQNFTGKLGQDYDAEILNVAGKPLEIILKITPKGKEPELYSASDIMSEAFRDAQGRVAVAKKLRNKQTGFKGLMRKLLRRES